MDFLTGTLCMSIGCAVAWLVALYTSRGVYYLIWDTLFGTLGAALCAWILAMLAPVYVIVGLVIAGPFFALLAIWTGDAVRQAISERFS